MGEAIAVIGGSGFIGTRLVKRLLAAGHDVRVPDQKPNEAHPETWRECDVRDLEALTEACRGCSWIFNLAAEHRDDVRPISLYDEVNVDGARNTIAAAVELGVERLVFVSSVAVYGFQDGEPDETCEPNPFNDYGRTKLEAERLFDAWYAEDPGRSLTIIRPTVVFGEGNRGNVYNLLKQIAVGPFLMIGDGRNRKSMAYVENVAGFLEYSLRNGPGRHVYNYVDKPDFDMNALVATVMRALGRPEKIALRLPYGPTHLAAFAFDALAAVTKRPLPISRIRIQKFCSSSCFSSARMQATGFVPPVRLEDALARTIESEFGGE
jgi:GlcNAc-P-P-Und epimerase